MQTKQSKRKKENSSLLDKIKRKTLLTGTIIASLIIACPFIFYLYQGFPVSPIWESPFGTFRSYYWEDINYLAWVILGKLIPFLLLLIWFFTCKHWWYHVILVPLCMYAFQIYSTLDMDVRNADTIEIYALAPIIFFMAIFSYTIRTRVFDKIHGIDLSELSRVNWKGELQTKTKDEDDVEDDEDDEPLFMSQE
ncbi:hypothetical protein ACFO3O_05670 [Dokdonia ponticola]|uniref:Uncharacterized protein n=1 Tax=Dokdonia ponticola TaxID=2041041 RepID=A0ABV9HTA2_9FLAO